MFREVEFQPDIEQKIKPRPPYRSQLPPWRSSKSKRSQDFCGFIHHHHPSLPPPPTRLSVSYTYIHICTFVNAHTHMCTCSLVFYFFLAPPFLPLLNSIAFQISHEAAIIMATNHVNDQLDYNKMHFIFKLPFCPMCSIWIY